MIATERLYYTRPELDRAEARVLAVEGPAEAPVLVLDRTVFYPEGGGQPCDLGSVGGSPLAAVALDGERILHRLAAPLPGLAVGASVGLQLDAGRRRDHAEQHSGQHLLSATCLRLLGAETKSFHLGAERSTIDIGIAAMDEGDLAAVEAEVNEVIAESYPIRIHVCPPEDLDSFPLRKRPPSGEEEIRVVEIDGIDYSPCCGTHLSSAGSLRLLKILGAEKYKGMTRVSFVAGGRALRDYAAAWRRGRDAAKALGSSLEDLAGEAARAALRLKEALAALERLKTERALLEAERALRQRPAGDGGVLLFRFADRGAAEAQEAVRAASSLGVPGLAASLPELTACASVPASDASRAPAASLSALLKPVAEALGGKGGGGPTLFRATFPAAEALEAFLAGAGREMGIFGGIS